MARSMRQRLGELLLTYAQEANQAGFTDEELKAQASQNADHTEHLIDIENARARAKFKVVALVLVAALVALALILGAALFVIQAVGKLEVPWARIGMAALSVVGASITAGISWWAKRAWTRRGDRLTSENPPSGRTEDDHNPVGTQ